MFKVVSGMGLLWVFLIVFLIKRIGVLKFLCMLLFIVSGGELEIWKGLRIEDDVFLGVECNILIKDERFSMLDSRINLCCLVFEILFVCFRNVMLVFYFLCVRFILWVKLCRCFIRLFMILCRCGFMLFLRYFMKILVMFFFVMLCM